MRSLNPAVPKDLGVVVATAIEKDAGRRYATAEAFAEDLRRVRSREPIHARPVSWTVRLWRWAQRKPAAAAALLSVSLGLPAIAALGGYIIANLPAIEKQELLRRRERIETLLEEAYDELNDGSPARSSQLLERVLEIDSTSLEAAAGMAMIALRMDDRAGARAAVEGPRGAVLGETLQTMMLALLPGDEAGRPEGSGVRDTGLAVPDSPIECFIAGNLELIRVHTREGDRAACRRAYDFMHRAVLGSPGARLIYHAELAHALMHLSALGEGLGEARAVADALIRNWPESSAAWHARAEVLTHVDSGLAVEAAERAVSLPDASSRARAVRALTYHRVGKYPDVVTAVRAGFALEEAELPDVAVVDVFLKSLVMTGQAAECLDWCERFHAHPPLEGRRDEPSIANSYAMHLETRDRPEEAETWYRRAIEIDPDGAEARRRLGRLLARCLGRPEEGVAELRRSMTLEAGASPALDRDASAWLVEAEALVREAAGLTERLASMLGGAGLDDDDAVRETGRRLLEQRRPLDAHRLFQASLEAHPGLAGALASDAGIAAVAAASAMDDPASTAAAAARGRGLDLLRRGLGPVPDEEREARRMLRQLDSWIISPHLRTVRDPELLARLPEGDRETWAAFWSEVAARMEDLR